MGCVACGTAAESVDKRNKKLEEIVEFNHCGGVCLQRIRQFDASFGIRAVGITASSALLMILAKHRLFAILISNCSIAYRHCGPVFHVSSTQNPKHKNACIHLTHRLM